MFIQGRDLLVYVNNKAVGHSKSCKISNSAETKKRAFKPLSSDGDSAWAAKIADPAAVAALGSAEAGLWKEKSVNELNVNITAEGFKFHGDEMSYNDLLSLYESGEPVKCKYAQRGEETTKYRTGLFIITSLEEDAPADDDATYSVTLESSGPVVTVNVSHGFECADSLPSFTKNGGTKHLPVKTTDPLSVTVDDSASWFSATVEDTNICVVAQNNTSEARSGSFTVSLADHPLVKKTVTVNQAGV